MATAAAVLNKFAKTQGLLDDTKTRGGPAQSDSFPGLLSDSSAV